jgi:hypothetical protein
MLTLIHVFACLAVGNSIILGRTYVSPSQTFRSRVVGMKIKLPRGRWNLAMSTYTSAMAKTQTIFWLLQNIF